MDGNRLMKYKPGTVLKRYREFQEFASTGIITIITKDQFLKSRGVDSAHITDDYYLTISENSNPHLGWHCSKGAIDDCFIPINKLGQLLYGS